MSGNILAHKGNVTGNPIQQGKPEERGSVISGGEMMRRMLKACCLAATLTVAPCVLAAPSVQVGFSPEGSALKLVLSTIDDAQSSIRLMGYSFTSPEVVKALSSAKRRGVDVKVVLDRKENQDEINQEAMNLLVNVGIPVRTVDKFRIMHDKLIITDKTNVETGSFNFTRSAAKFNSENAVLLRDMPDIAQIYLAHWQSRWDIGKEWPGAGNSK